MLTLEAPAATAVEIPLTCGQCEHFYQSRVMPAWGCCTRTEETKAVGSLACPKVSVICPF